MNVSWSWIEQRPHIIAKELLSVCDLKLLEPCSILRHWKTRKESPFDGATFDKLWMFPSVFAHKKLLNRLISLNHETVAKKYIDSDIFWLTHPSQYHLLPKNYKGKVVYDCMDDHVAMAKEYEKKNIAQNEEELIRRADLVFVSSSYLKEKIHHSNLHIVRNGMKGDCVYPISKSRKKGLYQISYFGTVDEWFDFKSIRYLVSKNRNLSFKIIGPTAVLEPIERVEYVGAVKHSALYQNIADSDCLIMPFVLNDIVLAVDPVKLYEYIAFGKCIISVRYPEVERFSPFVYFYNSPEDLDLLIKDLCKKGFPPKYTEDERAGFLRDNSWQARSRQISKHLSDLVSDKTKGGIAS